MIDSILRRPRALVLAAATAAVLALSACGGSDTPAEPEDPARPATIQVTPATLSFESLGVREQLTATVLDQDGNPLSGAAVTWSSADQAVATVTSRGQVRSFGNGTVTITASSGNASGQASVTVEQVAVAVELALDSLVLPWSGATTTLEVAALDAGGTPLAAGAGLTWTSSDDGVATVGSDGTVTGFTQGTAEIVAAVAGGGADTLPVRVASSSPGGPAISAVDPAPLVEGDTVTITGSDFGGEPVLNEVWVDGVAAEILTASAGGLTAVVPSYDCRPVREGQVVVRAFGEEADAPVTLQPTGVVDIPVGEAFLADPASDCLQLAAASGTPRYMVGIMSALGVPSSVTPARLTGTPGSGSAATILAGSPGPAGDVARGPGTGHGLPPGPVRLTPVRPSGTGPVARGPARGAAAVLRPPLLSVDPIRLRHAEMEAGLRERDRALLARLGPGAAARPAGGDAGEFAAQSDTAAAGDVINLRYPAFEGGCNDYEPVSAEIRIVSDFLLVAEDPENPPAGRLDDAYLRQLVDEFDDVTQPVLTDYFGDFTDLDRNGRLIVLVSRRVNDQGGILGFVTSRDFLQPNTCAGSNRGEVFYVATPDPDGETRSAFGLEFMRDIFPGLLGHEATHVVQLGNQVRGTAGPKTSWEIEGGATLAEQLIGFRLAGFQNTDNLTLDDLAAAPAVQDRVRLFSDWWNDMARYFGFLSQDEPQVVDAPEGCSWAGRPGEANNGPCRNVRAPYGTPSMFLRMILDRYGPAAGGEESLMRQLTLSGQAGLANLAAAAGVPEDQLLAQYSIALWADDRVGDWIPSWNKAAIFSAFVEEARLNPKASFSLAPEMSTEVRGASTYYSFWEPGSEHPATAFGLDDGAGGTAADHMRFWVLRIQ